MIKIRMHSFGLEVRVEFDPLFINADHNIVTNLDDAVNLVKFAIARDLELRKEASELLLRADNLDLMIGAKECSQLMLSELGDGRIRLELGVAVIGFVVVGHSFAPGAKADKAKEYVSNASLLNPVLFVSEL